MKEQVMKNKEDIKNMAQRIWRMEKILWYIAFAITITGGKEIAIPIVSALTG